MRNLGWIVPVEYCNVKGARLLVSKARGGPPDKHEARIIELFGELRMPLFRYLVVSLDGAEEAEDAAQECFLRLCRYLRQGGEVRDERLWLFHVARNIVLDRKKSGRNLHEVQPPDWDTLATTQRGAAASPEQQVIGKQQYEMLREELGNLTPQQREILRLREEGLGYREIAEVLSLNVPVVAAHIRRAVAKIKARVHG